MTPTKMLEQPTAEIRSSDGSRAVLRRDSGAEVLETRDARGRLVFEFHPATGRAVVHIPGSLEVQSEGEIRFRGRSIALEAERNVAITSEGAAIRLDHALAIEAGQTRIDSGEIALHAGLVQAETREVRFQAERLEQTIGRALLTARELLQRVHGLVHTRAGRVRTQTRADFTLQAKTANLVAGGEFRVQGETIHLG